VNTENIAPIKRVFKVNIYYIVLNKIQTMVSFFFKSQKNKRFEIKPRYYDERKEKLEELIGEHESEESTDKRLSRGSLRKQWDQRSFYHTERKKTSRRLVIIILILLFLAWSLLIRDNSFLTGLF